jgi:chloramphenicol 3-O phosphotransferase
VGQIEELPSDQTVSEQAAQGGIILLNGASSSGKSTLARMVQSAAPEPFLHLSSDHLVDAGAIPSRRDTSGPFGWPGMMRSRFFDGFHRCIPAMAAAGNNLIVDHIIEYAAWRDQLARLLDGFDVLLVGVHCHPDELDRREHRRGDRRPGEGRAHLEDNRIHEFGPYDIEVDATDGVTTDHVNALLTAWRRQRQAGALNHAPG